MAETRSLRMQVFYFLFFWFCGNFLTAIKAEAKAISNEDLNENLGSTVPRTVFHTRKKPAVAATTVSSSSTCSFSEWWYPPFGFRVFFHRLLGNAEDPPPPEEEISTAAANSEAYSKLKYEYPRYPAYPNSEDREALNFVIGVAFLFVVGLIPVCLVFLHQISKHIQKWTPSSPMTIAFIVPFLFLWVFMLFVVCQVWFTPMRGRMETDMSNPSQTKLGLCSEMLGYLLLAVLFGIVDLSVNLYYRTQNPSVEWRSIGFVSTIVHLLVHCWGAYLASRPNHTSYCKPLLSYTTLVVCILMLAFLGLYVFISSLWCFFQRYQGRIHKFYRSIASWEDGGGVWNTSTEKDGTAGGKEDETTHHRRIITTSFTSNFTTSNFTTNNTFLFYSAPTPKKPTSPQRLPREDSAESALSHYLGDADDEHDTIRGAVPSSNFHNLLSPTAPTASRIFNDRQR